MSRITFAVFTSFRVIVVMLIIAAAVVGGILLLPNDPPFDDTPSELEIRVSVPNADAQDPSIDIQIEPLDAASARVSVAPNFTVDSISFTLIGGGRDAHWNGNEEIAIPDGARSIFEQQFKTVRVVKDPDYVSAKQLGPEVPTAPACSYAGDGAMNTQFLIPGGVATETVDGHLRARLPAIRLDSSAGTILPVVNVSVRLCPREDYVIDAGPDPEASRDVGDWIWTGTTNRAGVSSDTDSTVLAHRLSAQTRADESALWAGALLGFALAATLVLIPMVADIVKGAKRSGRHALH